jgi:hypothetical protein
MFSGLATVRGKAPSGHGRPEARRVQRRRGPPGHPRRPPLHPGLAAPASVHVAGRIDAHGRRGDRGGGEQTQLHHGVADQGRQHQQLRHEHRRRPAVERGGEGGRVAVPQLHHRRRQVMIEVQIISFAFCQTTACFLYIYTHFFIHLLQTVSRLSIVHSRGSTYLFAFVHESYKICELQF